MTIDHDGAVPVWSTEPLALGSGRWKAAWKETDVASMLEDLDAAAAWISQALQSSGYVADFGPVSLWSIDRFIDDHSRSGKPRPRGLLAQDLGKRMFALGAYTGEVIRRNQGGTWHTDDEDPAGEVNVSLELPDGRVIWPVQRVVKRFMNGAEDGVAAYGAALGLSVGAQPPAPARRKLFRR